VDFAAAVGGFTLIGYLIDRHWQMYPKATLTGAVLGLIGGMYNLVRGALAAFRHVPPPGKSGDDEVR
jgi:F0F1-type ATP synthase assembly protein I